MAFGKIKLSKASFWDMTPREFFNAWIGHCEGQNERLEAVRAITYGAARYNAANTAFSSKAAKQISRHKFPWEKAGGNPKDNIIDYDKVKGLFNMISKSKKNGNA